MIRNTDRILTTHTGSLPRPDDLLEMLLEREQGREIDEAEFTNMTKDGIAQTVQKQRDVGIDLVNDGEASKPGYVVYIKYRLTGFEGDDTLPPKSRWSEEFPEFFERRHNRGLSITRPACSGPIEWKDPTGVHLDIANLKAATEAAGIDPEKVFMTAPSPGVITEYHANHYYDTHEAYLYAVTDVIKHEYDAIAESGFTLQIDCPDLTSTLNREMHIKAINHALRDIPPERMRLHTCWGNYEGPHHRDVPLKDIIELLFTARPSALSVEGANPRHEHEWNVFEDVKLPDEKVLIPGMIDSTTNYIEHPELVAQRIVRYAEVVGRENVIAGTDCGLATTNLCTKL